MRRGDQRGAPATATGARLAAVVATLGALGTAFALAACGEPVGPTGAIGARAGWADPAEAAPPPRLPDASKVPIDALAGQLVVTAVHRSSTLDPVLAGRLESGRVGGVIISDSSAAAATGTAQRIQAAARRGDQPPVLVSVDQEGGQVRRLTSLPPSASARALGARPLGLTADLARTAGCRMRAQGITLDLAPVADVPANRRSFVAQTDRAFSTNPATAGRYAAAFSRGLQRGGVGATVKHFPGLGTATVSSDDSVERAIPGPASVSSFRATIAGNVDAVMMSSATYSSGAWATGAPAVLSPTTVGWLRTAGFKGVVITDDLDAPGVAQAPAFRNAAVDALAAGVDLLLYVDESGARAEAARAALVAAVRAGQLPRARVEEAWARVLTLKYRLAVRRDAAKCPAG